MSEAIAPFDTSCFWGIGRGTKRAKVRIPPLAEMFAQRVTGKHNKDVKLFLVGEQGAGKSRSLLFLAVRCAEEIAKRKGGKWQDYFPEDLSNCIIGSAEGHADLLKHLKKYSVYLADDAGVSVNARRFNTKFNQSLNDIFQTIRTDNCILLMSAPDSFLIDKVPRTLFGYYGEVAESYHDKGFNLVKIFRMSRMFREGSTREMYLQFGGVQVIRHRFGNPPEAMVERYEILRDQATQDIKSNAGGKKPKERDPPQYAKCDACGYEWQTKVASPKKCPSCLVRMKERSVKNV